MGEQTSIEWTEATWNPIRGCSVLSPGCHNCYAMKIASRFGGPGQPFEGFAKDGQWTGRVELARERLAMPIGWLPTRVFVNSMSDVFHKKLSNDDIMAVFGAMAAAPQVTFQVLTKRADRMSAWFRWAAEEFRLAGRFNVPAMIEHAACFARRAGDERGADRLFARANKRAGVMEWPLRNVHLGVSVEDQQRADERVPELLGCPAAVRFISVEPLLERVELGRWLTAAWQCSYCHRFFRGDLFRVCPECGREGGWTGSVPRLSWAIVGGESGPDARPFDVAWARSLVKQCRAASVPVFVKQLGANVRARNDEGWEAITGCEENERTWPIEDMDAVERNPNGFREEHQGAEVRVHLNDRKGGDPAEWPSDLRVREFPEARS